MSALSSKIQAVHQESRKEIEGLFSKFKRVNQIFNKKTIRMEELERTVSLVEGKIDVRIGEITTN